MIVCAAKDGTWEAVDDDSTKKKIADTTNFF